VTNNHVIDRDTLPLQADLLIAGAHCALKTNSAGILDALSRWHCSAPANSSRTFHMEIVLDSTLPCHRDFKTQTHFRGLHHLVFATIGTHEVFAFDLLRKRVTGVVSDAATHDSTFWNTHWLPIVLGLMGTTVGVVPLHAACVEREGKGLLLAGVSGAGKSTLSLALAQAGFSLISDDWSYITQEPAALTAYGIAAPVKLLPDAVRHFPALQGRTPRVWFNGELAFEIQAEDFSAAPPKMRSTPRWLMFVERTPERGVDFRPYSATRAVEFFETNAEKLPEELPEISWGRSQIILRLAECECWVVRSGESPRTTAEAVSRFCERN
jgi:hypothetical protein